MMSRIALVSFALVLGACAVTADDTGEAPAPAPGASAEAKYRWECVNIGLGSPELGRGHSFCAWYDPDRDSTPIPAEPNACQVIHTLTCGDDCCDRPEAVMDSPGFCKQDCVKEFVATLDLGELNQHVYVRDVPVAKVSDDLIEVEANTCE